MTTIRDSGVTTPTRSPRKACAGPRGHWWRGSFPEYQRDPLHFYTQLWKDYGDYSRFKIFPGSYRYLLTHPDAVEHVLQHNESNYPRPPAYKLLLGKSLLSSEGDSWRKQRRLIQPALNRPYAARMSPLIVMAAERFVHEQAATPGQPLNIVDEMMKLTLRIASTTLFSTDLSPRADLIERETRTAFIYINERTNALSFLPPWPWSATRRAFARSKQVLDRLMQEVIDEHRRAEATPDDLLTVLTAPDETGGTMPNQQLKDNVLQMLLAGHETLGPALSWSWYLLGRHRAVQEDLYAEVHGRLHGRSPTVEDLPHLPFLRAVFDESMRLYPPIAAQVKRVVAADEIQGFPIPARSHVIVSQWITHRHPEFWDEPDTFKPARFLSPQAGRQHRFAYFPFSAGPRFCVGKAFALIGGPLVLATVLQQRRLELTPGTAVVPDTTIAFRPHGGMSVSLWPR